MKNTPLTIGTAGHIDHGKTSLVKALTGIDTDRLKEEKSRGVSIDLGFACLDMEGSDGRAAIIDVPGHERFIKNMLAGATGIDVVLFAVAADDGIMPQTMEHLDIIRLLGVKKGVFAITKADLASDVRIGEVGSEIESLVKGTALEGSRILPVSITTGRGIDELKKCLKGLAARPERSSGDGFFRLPVDRSFAIKGFGTVVTGTVASGSVRKGDELVIYPGGKRVKLRGIQSLYRNVESVSAGERGALNISGAGHNEIERGMVIAGPDLASLLDEHGAMGPSGRSSIGCSFEFITGVREIKNRSVLKVHHMTDETLATIRFHAGEGAKGRLSGILILKKPLLMLRGDRFILRDPSINSTVGGGTVEFNCFSKALIQKMGKTQPPGRDADLTSILAALMPGGAPGLDRKTLSLMLNMREERLIHNTGESAVGFAAKGDFVLNLSRFDAAMKKALCALSLFSGENQAEPGMKEDAFLKALKAEVSVFTKEKKAPFIRLLLDEMVSKGLLRRDGVYYGPPGGRVEKKASALEERIVSLFTSPFSPPGTDEIRKLPFDRKEVEKAMANLQRSGAIVKLKEGAYISGRAADEAKERLTAHIRKNGPIKAAEFRDLLGCGRKLAIEILEYFDKERVTLRRGDIRTLR